MIPGSVWNWIAVKCSSTIRLQQEKQNMTTPHLTKSTDRSPSRLALLLIPLLLACFAIPAMGEDKTPNHKEVLLNSIPPNMSVPCAGEQVDIRGQLKLKFGFKKFGPIDERPQFYPVDGEVAKGYGQITCPNSGQCDVGRGQPLPVGTGRKYTADTRIGVRQVINSDNGEKGVGTCNLFLLITGVPNPFPQGDVCPTCRPVTFKLWFILTYGFKKDGNKREVTFFKATPAKCGDRPPELKKP
jgi:hypothetical protein